MTKAYLIVLVKFTAKENFKADYGSKVADVFASFGGHFFSANASSYSSRGTVV